MMRLRSKTGWMKSFTKVSFKSSPARSSSFETRSRNCENGKWHSVNVVSSYRLSILQCISAVLEIPTVNVNSKEKEGISRQYVRFKLILQIFQAHAVGGLALDGDINLLPSLWGESLQSRPDSLQLSLGFREGGIRRAVSSI